jgi:hypothetical protein
MEQTIQMVLLAVWDWVADLLRDEYFLLWLGLLVGIGSIVNRGVNRLVEAQRDLGADLEDKLEKLSDKLESLEGITVDSLLTGIHGHIDHKYGESNGEAIRRWLDYRVDYGRSSPHLDEDDARAEALKEIFKEVKRTAEQPDKSETDEKP